jgi:formylglycine-generating enzyme required for sulfatase activity
MNHKINPALAGILALGAILFGCACLLVASLAGLGWMSWRNFTMPPKPTILIDIPAGEFLMGSAEGEAISFLNEKPQHSVYLDEYWIYSQKVSNSLYAACVNAGKCTGPGTVLTNMWYDYYENRDYRDHPVTGVTWEQARHYCIWAGGDLPTEAQWEKAARGTDGRIYPWGDTINCSLANYADCKIKDTTRVDRYPTGASPYGVLDMSGNVWEWTLDWYDAGYYAVSPASNPTGPLTGQYKVLRGGSWLNGASYVRAAYRFTAQPDQPNEYFGFRCVNSAGK